ncbi:SIS domain-containing protein [Aestuariivirga sp.]|uniref:D-sedoheptulose-7-phosphate isomerase n=1 Tax=Aestuariivirga sp. TaxID=2650926 RepID=UPI0039E51374
MLIFSISKYINQSISALRAVEDLELDIKAAATACIAALRAGRKVIFCGNGGSAADAQHLAAELMGRFLIDRRPLAALSLTVDTSALTAIGNDYGFENVFARQLRGIGAPGDILIGLSTSGNSRNVVSALIAAKEMEIQTVALTGAHGGEMAKRADFVIAVPHTQTNHIQEAHITIGHMICAMVEEALCSATP